MVGAQKRLFEVPIYSHPIALSRLIQNCTRGHLHKIRVQSKYRKVQSTASITWQGPEGWAGLRELLTVVSTTQNKTKVS